MLLAAAGGEIAAIFLELGAMVVGLAVLARLASRIGFSPIPFYLLGGLAFGVGGLIPLSFSTDFIAVGAEIGVILLMFMVGLEYTGEELASNLKSGFPAGLMDLVLNFTPGVLAGLLLGWGLLPSLLLGGVTYNTSTGVLAKVLTELDRIGNRETPAVLSISVMEDLAMAIFLPLMAVLLVGTGVVSGLVSIVAAFATITVVLLLAMRFGGAMSRFMASRSEEVVLLTVFGLVLLVAGLAQRLQISTAVGAFLLGIALSGEIAEQTRVLLGPMRDLFAAMFFLFFGLQIDPATLPPVFLSALLLAVLTAATKVYTGWWAARRLGVATRGRFRAGTALIPRGEFSIVLAGIGVAAGLEPQLGPLAAAYVLLLAISGPILARFSDPLVGRALAFRRAPAPVASPAAAPHSTTAQDPVGRWGVRTRRDLS
jgi:monovalent cation:H+ antiporter-2, CPA2 family